MNCRHGPFGDGLAGSEPDVPFTSAMHGPFGDGHAGSVPDVHAHAVPAFGASLAQGFSPSSALRAVDVPVPGLHDVDEDLFDFNYHALGTGLTAYRFAMLDSYVEALVDEIALQRVLLPDWLADPPVFSRAQKRTRRAEERRRAESQALARASVAADSAAGFEAAWSAFEMAVASGECPDTDLAFIDFCDRNGYGGSAGDGAEDSDSELDDFRCLLGD